MDSSTAAAATSSTPDDGTNFRQEHYTTKVKVMAIFSLSVFTLIFLIFLFYAYIRCRRNITAHRRRNYPHFFYNESQEPPTIVHRGGLHSSVVSSLPVFVYSDPSPKECPVCLSEFGEGEKGKTLPACNHSFHVECIDMWFTSHSTCPLCRTEVVLAKEEAGSLKTLGTSASAVEASSSSLNTPARISEVKGPIAPESPFNRGDDNNGGGGGDLERGDVGRINN